MMFPLPEGPQTAKRNLALHCLMEGDASVLALLTRASDITAAVGLPAAAHLRLREAY